MFKRLDPRFISFLVGAILIAIAVGVMTGIAGGLLVLGVTLVFVSLGK